MDLCSLPRYLVEDFVSMWPLFCLTQLGFEGAFPDRGVGRLRHPGYDSLRVFGNSEPTN